MRKYAHGFNKNDSIKLDNMLGSGNNFRETCVYIYNQNDRTAKQSFEKMPKGQEAQTKTIKSLECTWSGSSFTQDIKYFEISDQMPNEIYVLCEKPFEISERSQTPEELWGKTEERSPTPEVKEEIRQPQAPQVTEKQKENLRKKFEDFEEAFNEIKEIWNKVNANQDMVNSYIEKADSPKETPQERSKRISESTAYGVFASSVNELKEKRAECESLKKEIDREINHTKLFDYYDDGRISEIIGYDLMKYRNIMYYEYRTYVGELAGKNIDKIEDFIEEIESNGEPTRQETPPAYSAYKPKPITSFGRPYGTDSGQHSSFGTGGAPTKAGSGHSANPPAQPQKAQDASAARERTSSLSGKSTYESTLPNRGRSYSEGSGTTRTAPQQSDYGSSSNSSHVANMDAPPNRGRTNTIASSGPSKYEKKSSSKIRNFLDKILPKRKTSQSSSKIEFYNRTQNPNAQPFEEKQSDHKLVKNVDMICYKNYNEFRSLGFSKPDGFWKSKEINDYKCSEYYTDEKGTIGKQSPPKVCKIIISVNDISPRSALIFCDTPPTFRGDRFNKDDKKVWDEFKKLQKQAEKEAKKIQKPKKKSKL